MYIDTEPYLGSVCFLLRELDVPDRQPANSFLQVAEDGRLLGPVRRGCAFHHSWKVSINIGKRPHGVPEVAVATRPDLIVSSTYGEVGAQVAGPRGLYLGPLLVARARLSIIAG